MMFIKTQFFMLCLVSAFLGMPNAQVVGILLDSNQAPIAGAQVYLASSKDKITFTDVNGAFVVGASVQNLHLKTDHGVLEYKSGIARLMLNHAARNVQIEFFNSQGQRVQNKTLQNLKSGEYLYKTPVQNKWLWIRVNIDGKILNLRANPIRSNEFDRSTFARIQANADTLIIEKSGLVTRRYSLAQLDTNLGYVQGLFYGELFDSRDGKVYKTIKIGTQVWMAENLNFGSFVNDGNSGSFYQNGAQKFCYNNDMNFCTTDGGLYQWHTALGISSACVSKSCVDSIALGNHRGICPVGWHLPKPKEWRMLNDSLGKINPSLLTSQQLKSNHSGFALWDEIKSNDGNSSGFSALPTGTRGVYGGFWFRGEESYFSEAAENNSTGIQKMTLIAGGGYFEYRYDSKKVGSSVRCLRD